MFDSVYCISLPNAERRAKVTLELSRAGLPVPKFVHADKPPKGFTISNMRRNPAAEFGCALSHVKAITWAIADRAKCPLFIEDDVIIRELPDIELPPDWRVLYLGGHPREKATRVSDFLVKVGKFSCAEAYAIREPIEFLNYWFDRATKPDAMFDFVLGEYAAGGESFCTYPIVTYQPPNYSSIGEKMDDKRELIRKGWANNLQ